MLSNLSMQIKSRIYSAYHQRKGYTLSALFRRPFFNAGPSNAGPNSAGFENEANAYWGRR